MTKQEASEHLADTLAQHVENDFPLNHLTGDEWGYYPDLVQTKKLYEALRTLGYGKASEKLRLYIKLREEGNAKRG
jgi:hypothetical protein